MVLTNALAALAIAALGFYTLVRAPSLASDERGLFRFGDRYERVRVWSYRFGGAFLVVVAVGLAAAGVN